MFFINRTHQGSSGWQDLIDEDEDRLLWRELDTLADDVYELSDGEILEQDPSESLTSQRTSSPRTDGTRYFFLSIVGMSVLSAFSQIT